MSIAKMIESLPEQKNRRGVIVAVEGCESCGKSFLIEKIKAQLGIEEQHIFQELAPFREYHTVPGNYSTLICLAHLHELVDDIHKAVNEGKTVIIENYVMFWLTKALYFNAFGCKTGPRHKVMTMLLGFLKDLPVPDLVLFIRPTTETLVSRYIKDKRIEKEDDYVFHQLKEEAKIYNELANNGIIENVCILQGDSITKETEAVNIITCTAAIDMNNRPVKVY
jgi:thymidylate kinase